MAVVTILGATGRTGAYATALALERGFHVTALVRSPERMSIQHERLVVVRGDASSAEDVALATPAGTTAILFALGHAPGATSTVLEDGVRNVLAQMEARRIRRLVALSASGMHVDGYDGFFLRLAKRLIVQRIFADTYADASRMESLVRASDRDWTILAAPRLVDETTVTPYRTAIGHNLPRALQLSRINFADAMLRVLDMQNTFGRLVSVGR